jgi:hypothetical protein
VIGAKLLLSIKGIQMITHEQIESAVCVYDKKLQSQLQFIKMQLLAYGFISRNQALRNYISRLQARIFDLKTEGYNIISYNVKTPMGTDFVYELKTYDREEW